MSPTRVTLPTGPGSIEGLGENADVDVNFGLLGYGIALEVPSGQANLAPTLRLGYQSGAGNGVVGMGWSMTIPSVSRMTSRGLPRYVRSDRFVADDGLELVAVDPVRGVYRARFENAFVRYTWLDPGNGNGGGWRAEYPDGRVAWFGADESGRVDVGSTEAGAGGTFRWQIRALTDTHGHVVRYEYRRSNGRSLLSSIRYGSADGSRYEVRLSYGPRPDPVSDATSGVELRLAERLVGVTVLVQGVQLRRYALDYEPDGESGGLSRLRAVARYGEGDAGPFPVRFSFGYTPALPCSGPECSAPQLRRLGSIGADLRAGTADFVDLNGDGLPEGLDTRGGTHQIRRNRLAMDGAQSFETPTASTVARGGASALGPRVQLFDVDGDGFVDLLDGTGSRWLRNTGNGDWGTSASLADANMPDLTADADLRFFDYDGDRRPDLVHSDRSATWYRLRRADGGFETRETPGEPLGWSFSGDNLRLADINGDGLEDAVVVLDGAVAYRLSLGLGRWAPRAELSDVPQGIVASEAQLGDVNGDGLTDLVFIEADRVRYALNRGGTRLEALREIRTANGGAIPLRTGETSVRLLDLTGNGSSDVVWVTASGEVTALELFPTRPNLLRRIDNGIGRTSEFTYDTATAQMARDGGPGAWRNRVPFGMQVVSRIDEVEARTGVRQRRDYRYHHGYWDGVEGQFRGFEEVEVATTGDDTSEAGLERFVYDVGSTDRARKGLLLSLTTESAGRVLDVVRRTYQDCTLAEIPAMLPVPVRWLCEVQMRRELREGAASAEWITTGEDYAYDGYGNRTRVRKHGVLLQGAGACGACNRDETIYGTPCGPQCLGDEQLEETEYVSPARAGGRWLLRRVATSRRRGREGEALVREERNYYDGEPYRGLPLGELTRGDLVRTVRRLEADGGGMRDVETVRNRVDVHGNVVETRDANGHRRTIEYDADGILVRAERLHLDDRTAPYSLVFRADWHPLHEKMVRAQDWSVEGRSTSEALRITGYAWDPFGRMRAVARPGDSLEDPTEQWRYELAAPLSRIVRVARSRSASADVEEVQCFDGFGRALGTRTRLGPARWLVEGWASYDARGHAAQRFQPFEASDGRCSAPPAGVLATTMRYDQRGRELATTLPDAARYDGRATEIRRIYAPLAERRFDGEDTDAMSAHRDTPTVLRRDGLDRLVSIERTLERGARTLRTEVRYDSLGRLRGHIDPEGHEKTQRYDLFDRVVEVLDPDSGRLLRTYDDVGNLVRETDGRGTTVVRSYDEGNRLTGHWDAARPDATRVEYVYDVPGDCGGARCTNVASRLATVRYPFGARGRGVDRYGYDEQGRETLRERTLNGVAWELLTRYDRLGRVVGRRFPGGRGFDFVRDGKGRVVNVPGYVPEVSYDARGQRAFEVFANGVATAWRYDERLRTARIESRLAGGASLQALTYRFDRTDNIVAIDDQALTQGSPSWSARYEYDDLYRLRGAILDEGRPDAETLTWRHDDGDDIIEITSSRGSESAAHVGVLTYGDRTTAGPHAVVRAGDRSYSYDRAGNVTQRGDVTLSWDHLGRLVGATRQAERLAQYDFGPDQQRLRKVEGAVVSTYLAEDFEVRDGVAVSYLVVDGRRVAAVSQTGMEAWTQPDLAPAVRPEGAVLAEPDGRITAGDAWIARAHALGSLVAPAAEGTDPDALLRTAAATLLAGSRGEVRFFHHDHLGSVQASTDAQGAVASRSYRYPYGQRRAGLSEAHGFQDKEEDTAVGMTYFGYRSLDAQIGRWASADPISTIVTELLAAQASGESAAESRPDASTQSPMRSAANGEDFGVRSSSDIALPDVAKAIERTMRYAAFLSRPTGLVDPDGRSLEDARTGGEIMLDGAIKTAGGLIKSAAGFGIMIAGAYAGAAIAAGTGLLGTGVGVAVSGFGATVGSNFVENGLKAARGGIDIFISGLGKSFGQQQPDAPQPDGDQRQ